MVMLGRRAGACSDDARCEGSTCVLPRDEYPQHQQQCQALRHDDISFLNVRGVQSKLCASYSRGPRERERTPRRLTLRGAETSE